MSGAVQHCALDHNTTNIAARQTCCNAGVASATRHADQTLRSACYYGNMAGIGRMSFVKGTLSATESHADCNTPQEVRSCGASLLRRLAPQRRALPRLAIAAPRHCRVLRRLTLRRLTLPRLATAAPPRPDLAPGPRKCCSPPVCRHVPAQGKLFLELEPDAVPHEAPVTPRRCPRDSLAIPRLPSMQFASARS